MPSPTYADTPSRTVAALIRIPFMGGVPSVRFCVAREKNHWRQSPFRDSPTRLVTLRNERPPGSKKGLPGPPPGFVLGESGDRDLCEEAHISAKDSRRAISVHAHLPCIAIAELVRTMGVEPIPPFGERILSPLRLPFRHVRFWPEKPQNCSG